MTDDAELLRRYAETRSETAFAELVQRHIGLVYSVALRQTCDAHRADDVVQAVFTDLARKAASLSHRPVLAGWLYRSAQFAAADLVRTEQRRARREQKAHIMEKLTAADASDLTWEKVRPLLDEAMSDLPDIDRDAVLLRFFDDRPFAEIGARLELTENAARMRVERALDKLHAALARRGVTSTAATLGLALAGQAGLAAPAGLAASVTAAALAGTAAGGSAAVISFMAFSKLQLGFAAGAMAVGIGAFVVYQQVEIPAPRLATDAAKLVASSAITPQPAPAPVAAAANSGAKALSPSPAEITARASGVPATNFDTSGRLDQIQLWLAMADHPAVLRAQAAEARKMTMDRYGDLFAALQLGPERTEAFARLLDEKRQAPMDIAVADYRNGIDPRANLAAFEAAITTMRDKIDQEIRASFGDSAYLQYIDYNREQGVKDTFTRLGRVLDGTPDVLTPEQSDRLKTLLKTNTLAGNLTAENVAAARAFLSPPQMDALEKAFAQQNRTKAGRRQDVLPSTPDGN
jgi:RNA polymerase sigma factor (sigma-70 family)